MRMKPPSGPKKTNPNKAKTNPIKACPELAEALSADEGAVEWANFKRGVYATLRSINATKHELMDRRKYK